MNNNLTWKEHLYGDNENEGLITQLKKRVGTLKRLAKYMNKSRLSMLSEGIFYSKLVYCLAVIGNVSGMFNYREGTRMAGMTADDINKLQVIQNSLNRLLTGARKGTPTKDLLERTDRMSIMQMVAYHTLTIVHKVIQTGKPEYIANKLEVVNGTELERRAWGGTTIRVPRYNREISRAVKI